MASSSTAQAQMTSGFSRTQSLILLKNMIRISLSSICHERGIFDEDCFKMKVTQYLSFTLFIPLPRSSLLWQTHDGLQIHQLDSAAQQPDGTITIHNHEAFMLTQWLERGVFKALEEQYLQVLFFCVRPDGLPLSPPHMHLHTTAAGDDVCGVHQAPENWRGRCRGKVRV